jgi:hypothetical protein
VGYSLDERSSVQWGFLRESNGNITVLDPGQLRQVVPTAITDDGVVIGSLDGSGFIRDALGNYTTFSAPGSPTRPVAINGQGTIIGYYFVNDEQFDGAGFYRLQDGTLEVFSPPGAIYTYPAAIGANGDITGYYMDDAYQSHIFIWINPNPPATSAVQTGKTSVEPAQ